MRILWIFLLSLLALLCAGEDTSSPSSLCSGEHVAPSLYSSFTPSGPAVVVYSVEAVDSPLEFVDNEETKEETVSSFATTLPAFFDTEDRILHILPFFDRNHLLPRPKKYLLFHSLRIFC